MSDEEVLSPLAELKKERDCRKALADAVAEIVRLRVRYETPMPCGHLSVMLEPDDPPQCGACLTDQLLRDGEANIQLMLRKLDEANQWLITREEEMTAAVLRAEGAERALDEERACHDCEEYRQLSRDRERATLAAMGEKLRKAEEERAKWEADANEYANEHAAAVATVVEIGQKLERYETPMPCGHLSVMLGGDADDPPHCEACEMETAALGRGDVNVMRLGAAVGAFLAATATHPTSTAVEALRAAYDAWRAE